MKRYAIGTTLCIGLSLSAVTQAGGLWIHEYGDPTMGRAGAGSTSTTDDASAALHNPAAMGFVPGEQVMVTAGFAATKTEFDIDSSTAFNGSDDGGDAGGVTPVGSVFYLRDLAENWKFGVYAGGYSGAGLEYNDQWVGRFQAQEVDLMAVGVMPSVSFKVTDNWSFGFGVPIVRTSLEIQVALPGALATDANARIDGDDTQVAYNLSTFYQLSDSTRFGLMYQSELQFDLSGNADVRNFMGDPKVNVDTELNMAKFFLGSVSHDFSDRLSAHLTIGWEGWNTMDNVFISGENNTVGLKKDWTNIWNYGAGIEYDISEDWTINAGLRFDEDPTEASKRTADMPIDEQMRYAFGVNYNGRKDMTIGAHVVYADFGDAEIDASNSVTLPNPNPPPLTTDVPTGFNGTYDSNEVLFFSVSVNWVL